MSHPSSAPVGATPRTCAACGAAITGRFCTQCGAPTDPGLCSACRTPLSPGARFCHRCGTAVHKGGVHGSRERLAWIVAGSAVLVVGLVLLWRAGSFRSSAAPEMANAGNAGATPSVPGQAPDISAMSPGERFDRLFDRVVRAGESGDSLAARQFSPMALDAYGMLDSVNTDLRFHAALIHLAVGDMAPALALADTILLERPGHLFGYVIRGEVAERQNQPAALTRNYRDFLAHYDAELRAGRSEYSEHKPILDDFRVRAEASRAKQP